MSEIIAVESAQLQEEVSQVVQFAQKINIKTETDFSQAGVVVKMIKERRKIANTVFDPSIKTAHKAHKETIELKKRVTEPLDEAESIIKEKISKFVMELDKKHKELQAKAGDRTIVPLEMPKITGVSIRKRWVCNIMDESKLNPTFLVPDMKKINDLVGSLGEKAEEILGKGSVQILQKNSVAVRS